MVYLAWAVLILGLAAGLAIIPFGLAGTFVIVGFTALYAFLTHFQTVSWSFLGILIGISVLVEVIEFFMGAAFAHRHGSSSWGMWGAMIGGFVGAGLLTPWFPILGTVLGGFVGAFAGALIFEWVHVLNPRRALHSAWGAFLGAVTGRMLKIAVAMVMILMILLRVL